MQLDALNVIDGTIIETDICIIGGGPAGLSLAQEFIGTSTRVCLLESGSLTPNKQAQSLDQGTTSGDPYLALDFIRSRQLGGTANQWNLLMPPEQNLGVRYGQYDAVDFEQRDWLPHSGWCLDLKDLAPFHQRAQSVCQLGPFEYDATAWEDGKDCQWPLKSNRLRTTMFQFGPKAVFTQQLPQKLQAAENITVYINANAVELETDATAESVDAVKVVCFSGHTFRVRANQFVLANGAIDSARLLLTSNQVCSAGLGNQHDLVGRYFMDHPFVLTGFLTPFDRTLFDHSALYDKRRVNGTVVMAKLALTDEVIRDEQVMNMSFLLFPRRQTPSKGLQSLKKIVGLFTQKRSLNVEFWKEFWHYLQTAIVDSPIVFASVISRIVEIFQPPIPADLRRSGWSDWKNKANTFRSFYVFSQTEQAPHPDNRVTLDSKRDPLGYPKVKLHWKWREMDIEHVKRAQEIAQEELARAGIGHLFIDRDADDRPVIQSPSSHHLMGTTRMHPDPEQGVVDANGQVHGVKNLFITGSAIFPTGGYANPTLMIVALAIRLADHLQNQQSNRATEQQSNRATEQQSNRATDQSLSKSLADPCSVRSPLLATEEGGSPLEENEAIRLQRLARRIAPELMVANIS